jgi:hypothetical protein
MKQDAPVLITSPNAVQSGRVLISTATASASATLDLALDCGSFLRHEIDISGLVMGTSGITIYARFSFDGGVTYDAAATTYRWANYTPVILASFANDTKIELVTTSDISNTGSASGFLIIYSPPLSSLPIMITSIINYFRTTGDTIGTETIATLNSTRVPTHIRFLPSSGTLTSGVITVYGII